MDSKTIFNVSYQLHKVCPYTISDIESIESSVTSITIPDWTCNDSEFVKFDFSQFTQLQSLEIGDDCFGFVNLFRINGLSLLKRLKIGKNSFTLVKEPEIDGNSDEAEGKLNNSARSFHITNCEQLESIRIAECSFCDFAGEFELGNLPALKTLKIGTIGRWSFNFFWSSFVVRDLPKLETIELGNMVFFVSFATVIENLPSLQMIDLGYDALVGDEDSACSLTMRKLPKLSSITSEVGSFLCSRTVTLEDIPNLSNVRLPDSFKRVKSNTIFNVSPILADCVTIKSDV